MYPEDRKYEKTPKIKSPGSDVSYVIDGEGGLVDNETIKYKLQGYPIDLAIQLRDRLVSELPGLREKLNFNSKYLGYANENRSDALYVYIQKKQLVLDVRVSKDDAEKLRIQGFKVNPRNNYQCRTGWLTGLAVPHDTNKLDVIVELALMALRG